MDNALATTQPAPLISTGYDIIPVAQIKHQTEQVKVLIASCMDEGMHYGKIPGCGSKPTLLQPGAQKLTLMFNIADTYEINRDDLPGGHREYTVTCRLTSKSNGAVQGSGVGLCSTLEKKYRYRKAYDGKPQENPDIADVYNTVLKMSCKRALVSACLNTLAVSDLFTQDIEDLGDYAVSTPGTSPEPPQTATTQATPIQAPAPTQASATQAPEENRCKALWKEVTAAKARAVEAGVQEGGIAKWAAASITLKDGSPKPMREYSADEITWMLNHIETITRNMLQLKAEKVQATEDPALMAEDIPF